jgi:hypothetical protein
VTEKDVLFVIGILFGLFGGYQIGHGRGYIAGVRWCTDRLDDPIPPAHQQVTKDTEASQS